MDWLFHRSCLRQQTSPCLHAPLPLYAHAPMCLCTLQNTNTNLLECFSIEQIRQHIISAREGTAEERKKQGVVENPKTVRFLLCGMGQGRGVIMHEAVHRWLLLNFQAFLKQAG